MDRALTPPPLPTEAEVAAFLRDNPAARQLGLAYEAAREALTTQFPALAGEEEYTLDEADAALRVYLFWWLWGN